MNSVPNIVANIVTKVVIQCHFYSKFVCPLHMKKTKTFGEFQGRELSEVHRGCSVGGMALIQAVDLELSMKDDM